ncbi:histidine kinase [Spirosoma taeanense]|uniref:Histidine kinase n=1 Tax=Spirosoma taeanense TaxID=2735870 RepID=A0A6M5Y948_9BACT|nr:histidine kinase [Spirosoma taeanense]QJW89751.1 histidine kinase [Spirosoma taeanense]
MIYETWLLLFLGILIAMLLYNIVQWALYRERIYGLYTLYMVIWLGYFSVRQLMPLSDNVWSFVRITGSMLAYVVYYEFTIAFLNLGVTQPKLLKVFRATQVGLLVYVLIEAGFCFLSNFWQQPAHDLAHLVVQLILAGLSGYIIFSIYQRKDFLTRLFITGSAFLMLGAFTSMMLTRTWAGAHLAVFWQAPLTYIQLGIVLELLFFSLGLAYRHRQDAIKKVMFEQALSRERWQRWQAQLEAELAVQRLKQEVTEMQMKALQAQLSPHFLFNSLNSLSSLIAESPSRAEHFVDELSNVYRYLLEANDRELTTLATEMKFINSYYHLLKTRYGQGINLEVAINDLYQTRQLPPLTLQLLVENAVKPNVVSADNPLFIHISTNQNGTLLVRNNLQRKRINRMASTKKGLQNISMKYKLLNQPTPEFRETDDSFSVLIPLLPSSTQFTV